MKQRVSFGGTEGVIEGWWREKKPVKVMRRNYNKQIVHTDGKKGRPQGNPT